MNKLIFDYLDYRLYLRDLIAAMPNSGRGIRADLAEVVGCQRSVVSQVLSLELHFSLEQAMRVSGFFELASEEADFFILLVEFKRAGTKELTEFFRGKIKKTLNDRLTYDKRLRSDQKLSFEDQVQYYSAWYYGAICVALGVPELQTAEKLSVRLGLAKKTVQSALEFLEKCGLVRRQGQTYVRGEHTVHLGDDSSLLPRFHTNWRVRTIAALQQEGAKDLHYSCAMTLSKEDTYKLQAMLVKYIEEFQKQIAPSKDETVAALCIDFFEL